MRADICWQFCDNKGEIRVHGECYCRIIAGLGHAAQAGVAMVDEHPCGRRFDDAAGGRRYSMCWASVSPEMVPIMEVLDFLGCRFRRDGKGTQGTQKTLRTGMESWWRHGHIHPLKSVHLETKRHRVVSHVFSTAVVDSVSSLWSVATLTKGAPVGDANIASFFQTKNERRRKLCRIREEDITNNASQMEELGLPGDGREERRKNQENNG